MTTRVPTPPSAKTEAFTTHGANAAKLIVLHDTEGGTPDSVVRTLRSDDPPLGIHWIVGENGAVIRGVDSNLETWHCGAYNHEAIGIEQCGFASYRHSRWMENTAQLLVVAWIIAWEAQRHRIPLELTEPTMPGYPAGVTTHSRLGSAGGGHHDPGVGYPLSHVMGMAVSITARGLGKVERVGAILHAHGRTG